MSAASWVCHLGQLDTKVARFPRDDDTRPLVFAAHSLPLHSDGPPRPFFPSRNTFFSFAHLMLYLYMGVVSKCRHFNGYYWFESRRCHNKTCYDGLKFHTK